MKSLTSKAILLFIFFLGSTHLTGQSFSDYKRLDTLLTQLTEHNKFMGTIAVSKDHRTEFTKAYGYADLENRVPATPKTKYRVGSVSKMFTSVMMFQLFEEKKLKPDSKLSEFYPAIPNSDKISILNMLLHRSGIWSVTDDSLYVQWCVEPKSHEEILAMIQNHPPVFEPDEKSEYSNSNFILLGYIIEKITGLDYSTNLQERICLKAGLKSTYYGKMEEIGDNESYSYSIDGSDWTKEKETDMSIPHGAGAVVSTTEDLVAFADALFDGKLISRKSLDEMTKTEGTYGKGIFTMPFFELTGYGHTGGIDGFRSVLIHYPSEKLSIAVCANAFNYNQNDILIGILNLIQGKPYTMPDFNTIKLSADQLRQFEGVYSSSDFPLKLTIKLNGETLTAQGTGQSAFPLEPVSETEFKFDAGGIKINFPSSGKLNIKQGGLDIVMTRE